MTQLLKTKAPPGASLNPPLNPKFESRFVPKPDSKPEPKLEPKLDPKLEPKLDPEPEGFLASGFESRFDGLSALIDDVVAAEQQISKYSAVRARAVEAARVRHQQCESGTGARSSLSERSFALEIGAALRLPGRTAGNLVGLSQLLVNTFPATLAKLEEGLITYRHACALIDHLVSIDPGSAATMEKELLPHAEELTAAKFNEKARKWREKHHPESIQQRRERSEQDREFVFDAAHDGMAYLTAYLPAPEAVAIYNRVTEIAKSLKTKDEPRTLTQLRVDVFKDLMIDPYASTRTGSTPDNGDQSSTDDNSGSAGNGGAKAPWLLSRHRGIRATVLVTVPVMTLLGKTDEPASLEGYGPIDAETARRLAADAPSFMRLLTHPETGVALSLGRKRYKVTEDLRTWLRVRDATCRCPGCNRSAKFCDVDHNQDWQFDGTTDYDNLVFLCKGHHKMKDAGWKVKQNEGGTVEWTSPSGRTYITEPELYLQPNGAPPLTPPEKEYCDREHRAAEADADAPQGKDNDGEDDTPLPF